MAGINNTNRNVPNFIQQNIAESFNRPLSSYQYGQKEFVKILNLNYKLNDQLESKWNKSPRSRSPQSSRIPIRRTSGLKSPALVTFITNPARVEDVDNLQLLKKYANGLRSTRSIKFEADEIDCMLHQKSNLARLRRIGIQSSQREYHSSGLKKWDVYREEKVQMICKYISILKG